MVYLSASPRFWPVHSLINLTSREEKGSKINPRASLPPPPPTIESSTLVNGERLDVDHVSTPWHFDFEFPFVFSFFFTYEFLTHVMCLLRLRILEHGIYERVIGVEQSRHRQAHNMIRRFTLTRRRKERSVFCASDFALMTSDRMFSFSVGNNFIDVTFPCRHRAFPPVRENGGHVSQFPIR